MKSPEFRQHNGKNYAAIAQYEESDNTTCAERFNGIEDEMESTYSHSNLVLNDDEIGFNRRQYSRHNKCHSLVSSKCAIGLLIAGLMLTVLIMASIIGYSKKDSPPTNSNVCTTVSCINSASSLLKSLDTSVDPCDDFYQFSCGGWQKKNPLPIGHSRWGHFDSLWSENQSILKGILDDLKTSDTSSTDWKAKTYYDSCLNLTAIDELGAKPIVDLIHEIGGWSLDDSWNSSTFDLEKLLLKSLKYGLTPLVEFYVGTDLKNSSWHVLQTSEGSLSLPQRSYYLNKTEEHLRIQRGYKEMMMGISELLGANMTTASDKFDEILAFEEELAKIMLPVEKGRDPANYHKVTIKKFQEMAPLFNWMNIFNSYSRLVDGIVLKEEEEIGINSMNYTMNVTKVVKSTKPEVIQNYFAWHLASSFIGTLGQPFIDIKNKYKKIVYGSDSSCIERWRSCVSKADSAFGESLGRLFIMEEFQNSSKEQAEEVVSHIKDSMIQTLVNADWMDDETTERAIKKAHKVIPNIGYPDYIFNMTRLNDDFKELHFSASNSFFENSRQLVLFGVLKNLRKLREPVDKTKWEDTPPTVNAYYQPTTNHIVFPAGILRPPFFAPNLPPSLKFGSMGFVVGHEISHGFDDRGRTFDSNGDMKDWWEDSTTKKFNEKSKCVEDQFNGYKYEGINVNGKLTLGENIADGGGVHIAYGAYMKWKEQNSTSDQVLPALPYTSEQLFFMAFAQIWCSVVTPESEKQTIQTNPHPPSNFRVNGVVSDSKEFAKAFKCSRNSPMNRDKKCRVW